MVRCGRRVAVAGSQSANSRTHGTILTAQDDAAAREVIEHVAGPRCTRSQGQRRQQAEARAVRDSPGVVRRKHVVVVQVVTLGLQVEDRVRVGVRATSLLAALCWGRRRGRRGQRGGRRSAPDNQPLRLALRPGPAALQLGGRVDVGDALTRRRVRGARCSPLWPWPPHSLAFASPHSSSLGATT